MRVVFLVLIAVAVLAAGWFAFAMNWNYSTGERAGWIQKFSRKGWICKTWEGELAMVSMPGAIPEKFYFTVWDEKIAADVNASMGKRVSLHYDEKVGLPTSCFGDTRHWVNKVTVVQDIPLVPGVVVPTLPPSHPPVPAAPAQPAPATK
jgi:hypothetical protein